MNNSFLVILGICNLTIYHKEQFILIASECAVACNEIFRWTLLILFAFCFTDSCSYLFYFLYSQGLISFYLLAFKSKNLDHCFQMFLFEYKFQCYLFLSINYFSFSHCTNFDIYLFIIIQFDILQICLVISFLTQTLIRISILFN